MTREGTSPLGVLARGVAAGLIGTAAMTSWQEIAAKLKKRTMVDVEERYREDVDPWEKAPAPAQLAKRVLEALFKVEVPAERIPLFTNAVHWGYGTALAGVYGLVESSVRSRPGFHGALFGMGVWTMSYATLVPMGLYKPPWRYPAKSIAKDVSYHLVYGTGVGAGFALVERASRR
jgi:uncharacterized membrane protein YagU involved in acid resistance